ncbi:MAG TPA: hypothetical protein VFD47_12305 [Actinomycetota bacterium]|nr:hypothetical protein [Actinomycetota bacterium]
MARRGHSAYSDAVKWTKLGRPRRLNRASFVGRCWQNSFVAGAIVLGIIGLLSPSTYGQTRGFSAQGQIGALGLGWPGLALAGTVLFGLVYAFLHREGIRWTVVRVIDPWRRPLQENPNYEGAVGALDASSDANRTRYVWRFVYKPLILAVLATFFAFSSAYFLVDATLAQFQVGWQQPVLGVANSIISALLWRLAAVGLSTYRLAASVHKTVSTGYL